MFPKQEEIEIPLLEALVKLGGQGKTKDVYPLVTEAFPQLTDEDLAEQLPSETGNKWKSRIRWVRQKLVDEKGEMWSLDRGVWAITKKGRQRLKRVLAGQGGRDRVIGKT